MTPAQRALCALYALCALCAVSTANRTYCQQLEDMAGEPEWGNLSLTEDGASRVLRLPGAGAAPRAAALLLRALLLHALRYPAAAVPPVAAARRADLARLARVDDTPRYKAEFLLSVATAWHDERVTSERCERGTCRVAGPRLQVLGRGAAPVTRRLFARRPPAAAADDENCLRDWEALRRPGCGFLRDGSEPELAKYGGDWRNISTCSANETCVVVFVADYGDRAAELARELGALSPPLRIRFEPLSDAELRAELRGSERSFLFFDYDVWPDGAARGVRPAPPPPCPAGVACARAEDPVSLMVGDARKLIRYAPSVVELALRFRPPAPLLRRILDNATALGEDEAACEAAAARWEIVGDWLECRREACDPKPDVRVYACGENITYYKNVSRAVENYLESTSSYIRGDIRLGFVRTACDYTDDVSSDFGAVLANFSLKRSLRGVIAMGAAAASSLRQWAHEVHVPLLLVAAPPPDEPGEAPSAARSTAPALALLTAATRELLEHCGWRRVALLREEGRCDRWNRSMGLGGALRSAAGSALRLQELVVGPDDDATLAELRALDARVVLLDASARAAARLLRAAQARGLTPRAGHAWLVLGAAGDSSDEDWRPSEPEFWYVTVSGGWRGGAAPRGLGGSPGLRAALGDAWTPHAAPLADALLLMLEGVTRMRARYPAYRLDPRWKNVDRDFFELLDNATVEGVTHDLRSTAPRPVFAHRWDARGGRLAAVWGAPGGAGGALAADPCGAVLDAAVCRTTSSGHSFAPQCHDFAWAVLSCVVALGAPALCAARAARRRRLARRDRAVEERALLRGGHSADEAAAAAALAEHEVPAAALRLLDELGAGHYGVVRLAVLRPAAGATLAVAAKTPSADAPAGAAAELLREAALLATLRHEHVVRFLGVCRKGGEPLVLMEHALHGDLRRYLRRRRPAAERARCGLPEPETARVAAPALTRLAREAAAALAYLEHRRLVHRDVRAANCLVDARHSLKLADFGMARRVAAGAAAAGAGEYLCKRRAMFPVLWMAPESLATGTFSRASDVWGLGVLLLELATLGERPFGAWSAKRVVSHVCAGGTPPLPRDAAPATRGVLALCWRREAEQRLTAAALVAYLAEHPRAVQPALELLADADAASPPTPDSGLYIDEWTVS